MVEANEITRDQVQAWIDAWKELGDDKPTIGDYIRQQVDATLDVSSPHVLRADGETVRQLHVADYIIDDLGSYDLGTSS